MVQHKKIDMKKLLIFLLILSSCVNDTDCEKCEDFVITSKQTYWKHRYLSSYSYYYKTHYTTFKDSTGKYNVGDKIVKP